MANLLLPRGGWGQQKPPVGTQLDRSHPLAYRLAEAYVANEGGGRVRDVVRETFATRSGTGPPWGIGPYGPVLKFNGSAGEYWTGLPRRSGTVTDCTIVARIRPSAIDDFDGVAFYRGTAGAQGLYLASDGSVGYGSGVSYGAAGAGAAALNAWSTVAISTRSGAGVGLLWANGRTLFTGTTGGTLSFSGASDDGLAIGRDPYGGREFAGDIDYVYVYDRMLWPQELSAIRADPYAMFAPPVWRRYYVPSAGGGPTSYPQTATATATTAPALVRQIGARKSAAVTSAATLLRALAKSLAATMATTATVAAIKVFLRSVSATATTSAALVRRIGAVRQATATTSAGLTRALALVKAASVTSARTVARGIARASAAAVATSSTASVLKVFLRSAIASVTTTAGVGRQVRPTIAATVAMTASPVRQVATSRSAAVTTAPALVRQIGRILTRTVTLTGSASALKVFLRSATASVSTTGSTTRALGFTRAAAVVAVPALARRIGAIRAAGVTTAAAIIRAYPRTLNATVTTTASLLRGRGWNVPVTATVTTAPAIARTIGKRIAGAVSTLASALGLPSVTSENPGLVGANALSVGTVGTGIVPNGGIMTAVGGRLRIGNVAVDPATALPASPVPLAFTTAGAATDPTSVVLIVLKPDGTKLHYGYPSAGVDGTLVRESPGRYYADVTLDQSGTWRFRLQGTGAVTAASEGSLRVDQQKVTP